MQPLRVGEVRGRQVTRSGAKLLEERSVGTKPGGPEALCAQGGNPERKPLGLGQVGTSRQEQPLDFSGPPCIRVSLSLP